MNTRIPANLEASLRERRAAGMFRELRVSSGGIDLCSNDYLGLARRRNLGPKEPSPGGGSTGSRLISGTTRAHEEFEEFLSLFHQTEAALLFGSGYEANVALLSCLGGRHDTIIYDELVHASIRDGIRLGYARSYSFRHNDLSDLRAKLSAATGECYIVVESLYSMDGDVAPLGEVVSLAEERGAYVIVDEAHATGVFGPFGEGLIQQSGLHDRVFARVHTFGKAVGYRGACVVGSQQLRQYMVNFARPFMYSTAPDLGSLATTRILYEAMRDAHRERAELLKLISDFRELQAEFSSLTFLDSTSPIQGIIVPGNDNVLHVERALLREGFEVRAIRAPTVPAGSERVRLCLHAFNTTAELQSALNIFVQSAAETLQ